MLADMLKDPRWEALFRPRKGHLLCFRGPAAMPPLRHGMMEMGYTQVDAFPAWHDPHRGCPVLMPDGVCRLASALMHSVGRHLLADAMGHTNIRQGCTRAGACVTPNVQLWTEGHMLASLPSHVQALHIMFQGGCIAWPRCLNTALLWPCTQHEGNDGAVAESLNHPLNMLCSTMSQQLELVMKVPISLSRPPKTCLGMSWWAARGSLLALTPCQAQPLYNRYWSVLLISCPVLQWNCMMS